MNKPVSVVKEEFTNKIVLLINESGLPPILMEPVLANCLNQIRAINEAQLKKDKQEWEDYLVNTPESAPNSEFMDAAETAICSQG